MGGRVTPPPPGPAAAAGPAAAGLAPAGCLATLDRPGDALAVTGLAKHFGGTAALAGIDLHVRRATVHALLGGNGSGKSTAIKILAGVQQADAGQVRVNGSAWDARGFSAADAHAAGLRFVHQDLGLFDDLSIAENFALAAGWPTHAGTRIRWHALRRRVAVLLDRFEIDADPQAPLGSLRPAGRTMVAIARALQDDDSGGLVLVLDEPTASLPEHEATLLLSAVRRRADRGQTVVLVSHRLQEVRSVADDYTVLRDGHVAGTLVEQTPTESELVELIAGVALDTAGQRTDKAGKPAGDDGRPAVVRLRGLCSGPIADLELSVREGEIVGVAGLLGSGRTTLLRTLFGDRTPEAGVIELDGRALRLRHPDDGMHAGIAYVPEDRAHDAAFPDLAVQTNISLSVLRSYWRRWRMDSRRERLDAEELVQRYGVKTPSVATTFAALSGGNQQKAVLARWLRRAPRLLLLDEPTQGVDVMSRADIYTVVRASAAAGCAVLVVSSDFTELAALCDRVVVLQSGSVVAEVPAEALTADRLVRLVQYSSVLEPGVLEPGVLAPGEGAAP